MLLSCLHFGITVSSQSISIDIDEIHVVGNIGDLKTQAVSITNNEENVTVKVTVNYSGVNDIIFMPSNSITISAGSTQKITIGFIVEKEEISYVTYFVNSIQYNQIVSIEIEKTNPSLMVFPSNPEPGTNVAFLLIGEGHLDAHGSLFCSESGIIYPIVITGGMGTFQIGENESGEAIARITGEGINPVFVNFTIGSSSNSGSNNNSTSVDLILSTPSTVIIGETKDISVVAGIKPMAMTIVLVTKPSGESSERVTNSFGKINILFNEIGTWEATLVSGAQIISNDIVCSRKQETLILMTNDPMTRMPVEIQAFQDSVITITYPDGSIKNGVDNGGLYSFTPSEGGRYSIHAESSNSVGDISFDVKTRPRVIITDVTGNIVDYKSDIGKMVYLRVVDSNNNPLSIDTVLKISDLSSPFAIPVDVNVYDSVGMWTPQKIGTYIIEFPGYGFYTSTESSLVIADNFFNFAELWPYIIFLIIASIVIIVYRGKHIVVWLETSKIWQRIGKKKADALEPK
jgi:hypothetical protein